MLPATVVRVAEAEGSLVPPHSVTSRVRADRACALDRSEAVLDRRVHVRAGKFPFVMRGAKGCFMDGSRTVFPRTRTDLDHRCSLAEVI